MNSNFFVIHPESRGTITGSLVSESPRPDGRGLRACVYVCVYVCGVGTSGQGPGPGDGASHLSPFTFDRHLLRLLISGRVELRGELEEFIHRASIRFSEYTTRAADQVPHQLHSGSAVLKSSSLLLKSSFDHSLLRHPPFITNR